MAFQFGPFQLDAYQQEEVVGYPADVRKLFVLAPEQAIFTVEPEPAFFQVEQQ